MIKQQSIWRSSFAIGNRIQLKINWLLLLVFLSLEVLLLNLGQWQLARMHEKEGLLQQFEQRQTQPSVELSSLSNAQIADFQPLKIQGQHWQKRVVYLANESFQAQDGYLILVPVQLNDRRIVWLNLGWVKALADRRELPTIPDIPLHIDVEGHAYLSKGQPILFEHALMQSNERIWILQGLDFDLLHSVIADSKTEPLSFIIRVSPEQLTDFKKDWQVITMPPEKHLAYAIQWFGLALTLLIIALVLMIKKRET